MAEGSNVVVVPVAVVPVAYGNVPDVPFGEINLGVVAGLDVVPAQPGQVLGNHHVYDSIVNVRQHPLKVRAVVVQAGIAVVHIKTVDEEALLPAIGFQNGFLRLDAGTVPNRTASGSASVIVVFGKAAVEGRAVDFGCVKSVRHVYLL